MKPVANIETIAVDRQLLIFESVVIINGISFSGN